MFKTNLAILIPKNSKFVQKLGINNDDIEEPIEDRIKRNPLEIALLRTKRQNKKPSVDSEPIQVQSKREVGYSGKKTVIKNLTPNPIVFDFGEEVKRDSRGNPIRTPVPVIKRFLEKHKLKEEQLNHPHMRSLYKQGLIEDITYEQMIDESESIKKEELNKNRILDEKRRGLRSNDTSKSMIEQAGGKTGSKPIRSFRNDGIEVNIEGDDGDYADDGVIELGSRSDITSMDIDGKTSSSDDEMSSLIRDALGGK